MSLVEARARDIVFHRHSDADPTFINVGCALYDTLQFPLLHPYGGRTWYANCKLGRSKITLAEYTKCMHLQDPGQRLQRMGRLTEEILLDNNSRILEERLNFIRHNQRFRKRVASIAAVKNPHNAAQRVGTVYLPVIVNCCIQVLIMMMMRMRMRMRMVLILVLRL